MATKEKGGVRSFYCKECGRRVRLPKDWSILPAVRKHYWAKHREVMQPDRPKQQ